MLSGHRRLLFLLGGVLLVLSLWGWWGGGTASHLFPEEKAASRPTAGASAPQAEGGGEEEGGSPRRVFDAAAHARSQPLRDPFHAEAVRPVEPEEPPAPPVQEGAVKKARTVPARKEGQPVKPPAPSLPELRGIMSFGDKRRALIDWNGAVETVAEGEQVGPWTVAQIGETGVTLTGQGAALTLTAR